MLFNCYCAELTDIEADSTSGTVVFVFIIMRHYQFSFCTLEHNKIFPVFRIFLCYDSPRTEKVRCCDSHTFQERPDTGKYVLKIYYNTSHSEIYDLKLLVVKNAISSGL